MSAGSSGSLRILFVASKLERDWLGGVGRVVAGTIRALAARGHDAHLAGSAPDGRPAELPGVALHPWPRRRTKLEQVPRLVRLQRAIRADVVHFHSALPHGGVILPVLALERWLGRPLVVVTPYTGTRSDYPRRLARAALHRVHGVVTNSAWGAERAVSAGAPSERTRVVPAGLDLGPAVADRTPLRDVVALARFVPSKGIDLLLDAFERAARDRPDWRLRIAGAGRHEEALRAHAARLACADRIEFLGRVSGEAKEGLLAAAGLGVVPSREDNFPGALLEFLARGIPSVASRVGGIPEIAEGGRAACLVAADDPAALARALAALMDSDAARARLARAARQAAEARSWECVAERLEAAYRELGATRSA